MEGMRPTLVGSQGATLNEWYGSALKMAVLNDRTHILILDGEPALQTLARRRSRVPVHLMLMRPKPQPGIGGRAKFATKLFALLLVRIRLGERLRLYYLVPSTGARSLPLRLLGAVPVKDPVSFVPSDVDPTEWRSAHGLPADVPLYLLAGAIGERKRAREIIDAFTNAYLNSDAVLVLAGPHDETVRTQLAGLPTGVRRRILSIDRYLADEALDTWIQQAQVFLLLYTNVGSSGLLQKAAIAATPVAVPDGSDLQRMAGAVACPSVPVRIDTGEVRLSFREHETIRPIPKSERPGQDTSSFAGELLGMTARGCREG